jgi:glycosyltransferase involved in cell wall biosynthesis
MVAPRFTVCIPSYNAAGIIAETLDSLVAQTITDWECLVVDDCSTDDTESAVAGIGDPRIRFVKNEKNLGYPGNLQRCFDLATGEFIYLLGNDDILSPIALQRTFAAFGMAPDVAVVTRPYYWFENDDLQQAVRYTKCFDATADRVLSPEDGEDVWRILYSTLAQLSGLAFRRAALVGRVNPWVFPAHVQLFLATFKEHRAVFLKDYPVAIRIAASQTRHVSSIYDPSPLWSWVDMFDAVFPGDRWSLPRRTGRDFVARNVEGLVQIRCYSRFRIFLREAWLHLWYRPRNIVTPKFWFFALGCLVMPPRALRSTVDRLMPFFLRPRTNDVALAR